MILTFLRFPSKSLVDHRTHPPFEKNIGRGVSFRVFFLFYVRLGSLKGLALPAGVKKGEKLHPTFFFQFFKNKGKGSMLARHIEGKQNPF